MPCSVLQFRGFQQGPLNPIDLFRICSIMTTQTTHLSRLLERELLTSRLGCVRLPA